MSLSLRSLPQDSTLEFLFPLFPTMFLASDVSPSSPNASSGFRFCRPTSRKPVLAIIREYASRVITMSTHGCGEADSECKRERETETGRRMWDVKWVSVDTSRWIDPGCTLGELPSAKSLAYAGINTRLFAGDVRPLSSLSTRASRSNRMPIDSYIPRFFHSASVSSSPVDFLRLPLSPFDSGDSGIPFPPGHNRLNHGERDAAALVYSPTLLYTLRWVIEPL